MRPLLFISILGALLLAPHLGRSQCKHFARRLCRVELTPYTHDGNYNAAILTEGEEAEMFKTFHAGLEYRIAVCNDENLEQVEFLVKDVDRNTLFSNRTTNFAPTWDFKVSATQQLIIVVRVPEDPTTPADQIASGCVAIMFGLKTD